MLVHQANSPQISFCDSGNLPIFAPEAVDAALNRSDFKDIFLR
jgi:hypothetical protein